MYGLVPPVTETEAKPSVPLLQLTLLITVVVALNEEGSVMVKFLVIEQRFASFIVTE